MKRIMVLSQSDFEKDENGEFIPELYSLKENIKMEEADFDIVAYLDKDKMVLFKNRFGSLASVEMNSELADLFS